MEKNKKIENKIVETYAEDMAEVLKNDREGLVKKMIHGEEEHEKEKENFSPESKENKLFMLASFFLIVFALIILFFFLFRKEDNTVVVEKQFTPIVFSDQSVPLEIFGLKKEEIIQAVQNEINTTKVKIGGIEGIYLTENKQIIGLRRFISLTESNFTPSTNTLLVDDNFLMGVVNEPGSETSESGSAPAPTNKDFFILIKMRSIADIFDAMRAWEGKMFSDLHGFFGVNLSADTNDLLTKDFQDGIVDNKNARILFGKDGQPALMYVFADDNSVVITDSQSAAHEIILRLTSSQKKQ
ncbi:MAG: hypothetical protein PHT16_00510 [Candidatus Pacebacteria bacterium]|nr:hypothetical protein [Candidatus Paceibacterota bacterium]